MSIAEAPGSRPIHDAVVIEIAGIDLNFRQVGIGDATPTGAQIAAAAGLVPSNDPYVLQFLASGELVEILASQNADLRRNGNRFVVVSSDRAYRIVVDGEQYSWPAPLISGSTIRTLAAIPADKLLYFDREDRPDRLVDPQAMINLDKAGVEHFHTRKETWKLKVQDVTIESDVPTIVVAEAMRRAGFDPAQPWHIFLKVEGRPKQAIDVNDPVDLRTPGIEKIRLTPRDVNNGEVGAPRRAFALLPADERQLDAMGCRWETVIDGRRRWLLISGYFVPTGYTVSAVTLALEIPGPYPGAQIDMFYLHPVLRREVGGEIPATQTIETIHGREFQRWSRHRGPQSPWDPRVDNVITHLALVESALAKEVN